MNKPMNLLSVEATSLIPQLSYVEEPVNIVLWLLQSGEKYIGRMLVWGSSIEGPIAISSYELSSLNSQLQEQMEQISKNYIPYKHSLLQFQKQQLNQLARLGHYLYQKVFRHPDFNSAIRDIFLSSNRKISMEIITESFFIPWELLYLRPVEDSLDVDYNSFLGMRCIISRVIPPYTGRIVHPSIPVMISPRIGLLTDRSLKAVSESEIPFFEELHTKKKIQLLHLRVLNPSLTSNYTEYIAYKDFLKQSIDLAHFACHAEYNKDGKSNLSYILLTKQFPITIMDMENYEITLKNNPIVILNACETGNLNPLYTASFARLFLEKGARAVIATECALPDEFAAEFMPVFYDYLLAGRRLGDSLFAARSLLLSTNKNPTGLLYSLYGNASTRLEKTGETSDHHRHYDSENF